MRTIYESIFDIDSNLDKVDVSVVKKFLKENYSDSAFDISDKPNKNGKFEVTARWAVFLENTEITSLTNDMFEFTKINGNFEIKDADLLEDLSGAPKDVKGCLSIVNCKNLKSLKGISPAVGKLFIDGCSSLKSIDYIPNEIYGNVIYNSSDCSEYDDIYIENCELLESMPAIKKYKKRLALRLFDCPAKSLKDIPNANVYNSWIYLN